MTKKHLTEEEKMMWHGAPLLPQPGADVVRDLLTTINDLRRKLEDVNAALAHPHRNDT